VEGKALYFVKNARKVAEEEMADHQ